ncbi:hypothetical protein CXX84_03480 [Arthrobacter sp. AFG7.2]|nr:hypothetical protein CXX84_03480 [Arthrobacter sp. AFG7.2]
MKSNSNTPRHSPPDMLPALIVTPCRGIAIANGHRLQARGHMWAISLPLTITNVMLRDPAPQHRMLGTLTQPSKYLR